MQTRVLIALHKSSKNAGGRHFKARSFRHEIMPERKEEIMEDQTKQM